MKRMVSIFLCAVLLCTLLPLTALAADNDAEITAKKAELESKYGINVQYPSSITLNALKVLDKALENVTPTVVQQVSEYYRQKNGKRLTFIYSRDSSKINPDTTGQATPGQFYQQTSEIYLFLPESAGNTMMTGENPIHIVHEFGHALHLMYTDKYGFDKMKSEWTAFNDGISYSSSYNTMNNPNQYVFVSGYAATMFEEDVAETIGHLFIRNQAGQGFGHLLNRDGSKTGLGKKVDYVEKLLTSYLTGTDQAVTNLRKINSTATSMTYQGMKFSGDYLQYIGYTQPRYILNGTVRSLGKTMDSAIWIVQIGGWYVKEDNGSQIIIFPGGAWCDVPSSFVVPSAS